MFSSLESGGNRTTSFVAQNHNEWGLQVNPCIFNAAYYIISDDISGYANHKEVTETLIEDELYRNTGVTASKNGGEGVLF